MQFDDLDLADLCITVHTAPGGGCVTFPGGVQICASVGLETGDPASIARSLMAQVNTALIPLQPIFDVIDVLKAAVDCIQAVPDIVGPPPDPSGVVNCIPGLLEALEKVLAIVPPMSIFPMVKGILNGLVLFIGGLELELMAMVLQLARVAAAATAAAEPGNIELQVILDCENGNMDATFKNLNSSIAPMNRLLGVVNGLCKLAGINVIPDFEELGSHAAGALKVLDRAVKVLSTAAAAIPG